MGSYCAYKPSAINVPITIMQFNVAYSAHIPVDHVSGPSYCYYQGISNDLIYMGDANRGTYRVTESVYTETDASPAYWGFFPDTGQTRNYGAQSPRMDQPSHRWMRMVSQTIATFGTIRARLPPALWKKIAKGGPPPEEKFCEASNET